MTVERNNFHILTGGPGAGKTTVLDALRAKGFVGVDEVGRQIIREQKVIGGNSHHNGDRIAYRDLMLERSIADFERMWNCKGPVFFDRGIPELAGYSRMIGVDVTVELEQAVREHRYAATVFIFPPWREIYANDAERGQDFAEAIATFEAMTEIYPRCGYNVIEVPKSSVEDRVDFILSRVSPG